MQRFEAFEHSSDHVCKENPYRTYSGMCSWIYKIASMCRGHVGASSDHSGGRQHRIRMCLLWSSGFRYHLATSVLVVQVRSAQHVHLRPTLMHLLFFAKYIRIVHLFQTPILTLPCVMWRSG